jgi:hypothetical protein
METSQNINSLPEIRNGQLPNVNQTSPPPYFQAERKENDLKKLQIYKTLKPFMMT